MGFTAQASDRLSLIGEMQKRQLPAGTGRHFLDHGENELSIAVVQIGGVTANLAQEADFIIGKLGQSLGTVIVARLREKL